MLDCCQQLPCCQPCCLIFGRTTLLLPLCAGKEVWVNSLTVIVINPKRQRGGGAKPATQVGTKLIKGDICSTAGVNSLLSLNSSLIGTDVTFITQSTAE
jgi:hypothetical protein